ncbi:MAG: metallophosphoesterase [Clostridia bacterium]|nr:metallophosphoesterase [Clostridia bacterium]
MKLGLFSDSHYSSAHLTCGCRYNSKSLEKMMEAYRMFGDTGCDLVLCLGDLTDTEASYAQECDNLRACAAVMDDSPIPTLCLMGNHDAFVFTEDAFYKMLGQKHRPHPVSADGVTLLFLDACHFSDGTHYGPGHSDWTNTCYPHTDALRTQLSAADTPVYVFMHQNLDPAIPENHRLSNDALIRRIFEESGVVHGVISGHYHPGKDSVVNGIRYLTLPALCEGETADAVRIVELG